MEYVMNLTSTLRTAWKDVEAAYNSGYVVNESMMAFVLLKAISRESPKLQITYDARIDRWKRYRPDVVIWQDGDDPVALFVCELKFKPEKFAKFEWDIEKLKEINQKSTVDLLTRNPKTGGYETKTARKSKDFNFGFFAIANWDAAAVTYNNVTAEMSNDEKGIFHFAYGSIPGPKKEQIIFEYIAPLQKKQP